MGAQIVLSTIANWYWQPTLALAILLLFAFIDVLLYAVMPDILVCYRCGARHSGFDPTAKSAFDLELAERYRQERLRVESAGRQRA